MFAKLIALLGSQFVDLLGTIIESSPTFIGQENDDDDISIVEMNLSNVLNLLLEDIFIYEENGFTDLCLKGRAMT